MPLDLATTFTISTVVHLMMAALLGLFWRSARRRGKVGFGWWVLNEAMLAVGALLLLLASATSLGGLALAVGNLTFLAGMPLLELGLRIWFGRRLWPGMAWRWGLAVLGYGVWYAAWHGGLDYASRSVIFTAINTLQGLLFGQYVLSQLRTGDPPSRRGLSLIALSAAVIVVMSLWRSVENWPYVGTDRAVPGHLLAVLMVVNIAAAVTRVSAMLLMLHGRIEARLQAAGVELERRANTDALTGVASRAHFEAASGVLLTQALASRLPVCLMVCDMDGFKSINDQLGHPEGDAVLIRFAALLRDSLRHGDLAGRLGGDEFAVLMFNCTPAMAVGIGERLREAAAALRAADGRTVSLSAGLVAAAPGEDFESLYRRADRALYAAKAAGRNRIVAESA
ncbi:diguanylate cyclase domain-containing protein [Roseateles sp. DC23W]|uniref:diguanylate cyclase n=1 Tax=Pelomonas dachongensis TaxID=3299029 RepID=A0ABW7EMK4_9BURK